MIGFLGKISHGHCCRCYRQFPKYLLFFFFASIVYLPIKFLRFVQKFYVYFRCSFAVEFVPAQRRLKRRFPFHFRFSFNWNKSKWTRKLTNEFNLDCLIDYHHISLLEFQMYDVHLTRWQPLAYSWTVLLLLQHRPVNNDKMPFAIIIEMLVSRIIGAHSTDPIFLFFFCLFEFLTFLLFLHSFRTYRHALRMHKVQ